jgi:hypothetical protein
MKMAALAVHHRPDALQEIRQCRRTMRVPTDYAQVVAWCRKAAEQGYASLWFRKAADQGGVDGQYSPGQIFEMGVGVPQDNGGLCVVQIGRVPAEDDANPRRDKQQVGCFGHQYNARSNRRGSVDPRTRPRSDPRKRVSGVFVDGRSLAFSTPLGLVFVCTWPPI